VSLWTWWNMFLYRPGYEGLLQRMGNSSTVLHNVELHGSVKLLYKDLELPICPEVFHQPM
jgi:hypothetical protein